MYERIDFCKWTKGLQHRDRVGAIIHRGGTIPLILSTAYTLILNIKLLEYIIIIMLLLCIIL